MTRARLERLWWERPEGRSASDRALACVLAPLGAAYGAVLSVRRAAYGVGALKTTRAPARVVCVGNLTVGGSGKTPVAVHLSRALQEAGVKVAYVSRGYGRGSGEVGVVSDGERIAPGGPAAWGDEPLLAAGRLPGVPVLVGARRADAVREAARRFGAEACVLDDGLQHLALRKDFSVLMVDGARGLGAGRLLPAGPLRDRPRALRAEVHAVAVKGAPPERPLPAGLEAFEDLPRVGVAYRPTGFLPLLGGATVAPGEARGKRAWLAAGVADPAPFRALCEELGIAVLGTSWFRDHHAYARRDAEEIERAAAGADWIVTTEKDLVRLRGVADGGAPWLALAIEAALTPPGLLERLALEAAR